MAIPTTEKNRSGPQRLKFPPWLPKLEPLPKRFFSRTNSKAPNCSFHVLINRMKQFFIVFYSFSPVFFIILALFFQLNHEYRGKLVDFCLLPFYFCLS